MNGMFISKSPDRYSSGKAESDTAGLGRFKEAENTRLEQDDKKYQPVRPRTHADSAAVDKLTSTIGERKGFAKGTVSLKKKKKNKFAKVMKEGFSGKLHSGKAGPVVTKPAQMKAIAASESGTSKGRSMPAPSGIRFTPKG